MSVKIYWLLKKLALWWHIQKCVNCKLLTALWNDPNDPISVSPARPHPKWYSTDIHSWDKLYQYSNEQLVQIAADSTTQSAVTKEVIMWLLEQLTALQQTVQQATRPPAQYTFPALLRQITFHVPEISNHQWYISRFRWTCKNKNSDIWFCATQVADSYISNVNYWARQKP